MWYKPLFFLPAFFLMLSAFAFGSVRDAKVESLLEEANRLRSFSQLDRAAEKYEEARRLSPHDPVMLRDLGVLQFETKQYDQAVQSFNSSLAHEDRDLKSHFYLAESYAALGRTGEAEGEYRKTLSVDPGMSEAEYGLGLVLEQRGNQNEAEELYRSVVAKNPGHAGAHFQLGGMAYRRGNLAGARQAFEQVIAMKPDKVTAYYNLGLVYRELGNYERARESFKRAITLDPSNPMFFYQAAATYESQGFLEEAAMGYDEALRLNPNFREAKERLESVKERLAGGGEDDSESYGRERTVPLFGGSFGRGGFQPSSPLDALQGLGGGESNQAGFDPKSLLVQAGTALVQQWMNSRSGSGSSDSNQE